MTACLAGSHKTESFSGGKNGWKRGFLTIFHFMLALFSAVVAPLLTSRDRLLAGNFNGIVEQSAAISDDVRLKDAAKF